MSLSLNEHPFLAKYDILGSIGRGAYSNLYHAKEHVLDREVSIKIWPTARVLSEEGRQQIQQELEHLAQLKHPSILPILETKVTERAIYIVSSYAAYGSLQTRLSRSFPLAEALHIIQQVGQGLHTAHQHNIIHGNLTPQNVLFTSEDSVVLTDFYCVSMHVQTDNYTGQSSSLRWYMAPELSRGVLDAKTDQYALACLAYELLTGQVPFSGAAHATLLQKHRGEQPQELDQINPAIPGHVGQAVLKALAKDAAERYSDVQAFLAALETPAQQTQIMLAQPLPLVKPLPPVIIEEIPPDILLDSYSQQYFVTGKDITSETTLPVINYQARKEQKQTRSARLLWLIALLALVLIVVGTSIVSFANILGEKGQQQSLKELRSTSATATTPGNAQQKQIETPTIAAPTVVVTPTATAHVIPVSTPAAPVSKPTPTAAPQQPVLYPVLECVMKQGKYGFLAKFGYVNNTSSLIQLAAGSENNALSPRFLNGAQPTYFSPGHQSTVLQISAFNGMNISWTLNGTSVTATAQSQACT